MAHFTSKSEDFPIILSDFSEYDGTCCYCAAESAERIRDAVSRLPLRAIHRIGTGDYHYVSLFWAERIGEPFGLVLFDNHPDDQPAAFGGDILSCGSWVADVRALPCCKADVWIRSADEIPLIPSGLPIYISIDLDVLTPAYARTDWDQGPMTVDELCAALEELRSSHPIIGVDICGGITEAQGGTDSDFALNEATVSKITETLNRI